MHLLIYRNQTIDTMADVQSMDKFSWIKTCKDLTAHFIAFIQRKYDKYDELYNSVYQV